MTERYYVCQRRKRVANILAINDEDYDEAVTRMDETDFDLIFADVSLGDKTGLDRNKMA